MASDNDPCAVGWKAIDAALKALYGDREPKHYGTILPAFLGGNDPLDGISAYKNLEPLPHFHYVTYGFSELYEKENEIAELSGFGFELTFRLACGAADEDPPMWVFNFLQNIARYVFSTGNALGEHHHVDLNGPIALTEETQICCVALAKDQQLGEIDSQNGHVTFLQVVGICADEYDLVKCWDCGRMLEYIGRLWPLLITDLKRHSILRDPVLAAEIRVQAEQDGSSQGVLFAENAKWETRDNSLLITLGATAARDIIKLLQSRLLHGKPFSVYGQQHSMLFELATENNWRVEGTLAIVRLSGASIADMLEALKAERGDYRCSTMPNVLVRVVPSEIKGQDGKTVRIVG
jgi:suppressor of fused